jgi:hypothetical protein
MKVKTFKTSFYIFGYPMDLRMESGDFVEKLVSFFEIWPLKNKTLAKLKKKSPFGEISPQKRTLALTDTQQRTPKESCFLIRHLGPRSRFCIVLSHLIFLCRVI